MSGARAMTYAVPTVVRSGKTRIRRRGPMVASERMNPGDYAYRTGVLRWALSEGVWGVIRVRAR